MLTIRVRVDKRLYFFTEKKYRSPVICVSIKNRRSAKDLVESLGIPHVEIRELRIDGMPSPLETVIETSCVIEVAAAEPRYPETVSGEPLFILDVHLGKLARNLRMLGFNADYSIHRDDAELAALSAGGILLSCDRGLMMRRAVEAGMVIRSRNPLEQAAEVLHRFNLADHINPFSRCLNCGGALQPAGSFNLLSPREQSRIPPETAGWCREYSRCSGCGQLYWKGSHYERILEKVGLILNMQKTTYRSLIN